MFDIETARSQARQYTALHRTKWIVMETAPDAPCNQPVANRYNTGRFFAVPLNEAMEYAEGGCAIADLMIERR